MSPVLDVTRPGRFRPLRPLPDISEHFRTFPDIFGHYWTFPDAGGFAAGVRKTSRVAPLREKMAEELGTPCEDECALESFPNLPPSVHPGVVTGQAMIDLLDHAKENGEFGCVGLGARKGCVCIVRCILSMQVHPTISLQLPFAASL